MTPLPRRVHRIMLVFILFLTIEALLSIRTPTAITQNSDEVTALAREAFSRIAEVYQSGGEAPELVARLNNALKLAEQARLSRLEGDEASALRLEEQAHASISEILRDIPAAHQRAEHSSTRRTLTVLATVPLVVALSTLMFYVGLGTWRWYERIKLFEMRIVEKKD